MEATSSLKQTVTHLFDAVRYSNHAKEVEEATASTEKELALELNKLDSETEEISNLISSMKDEPDGPLRELSRQLESFLETAKEQARDKLERRTKETLEDQRKTSSGERDKALKSLEAYLASDPLPVSERVVQLNLAEGLYEARATYECEGGVKYEFILATQNSKLFSRELAMSQVRRELRVPVRFAKTMLKGRVPGFERLDQYVLTDVEESGGKLRATLAKAGNGSKIKVVTSGSEDDAFVGLEYTDQTQSVNIMNDPSLSALVDLKGIKQAVGDLVKEMEELASKKISLVRLSVDGEDLLKNMDCYALVEVVFRVFGPNYREVVRNLPERPPAGESGGMGLEFLRERIRVLGAFAKPVSQLLGVQSMERRI